MNIGFYFNFEKSIGGGHFWRCLNIAKKLKRPGIKFFFLSNMKDKYFLNLLKKEKITFIRIDNKNSFQIMKYIKKNIRFFKIQNFILDSYRFNYSFEKELKKIVKKLIVIDDFLNRKHFCDLLINNNFLDQKAKKIIKKNNHGINLALGTEYTALNINLTFKKKFPTNRKLSNIFVFFGSSISSELFKVFKIVKFFPKLSFHIIVGNFNKNLQRFKKLEDKNNNTKIYYKANNDQIFDLINKCDLAIGAGGVNMLERISLNLPSLVTCVAKNQKTAINYLNKKKFIIYLGASNKLKSKKIKIILEKIVNNEKLYEEIRKKTFKLYFKLNSRNLLTKKLNSVLIK